MRFQARKPLQEVFWMIGFIISKEGKVCLGWIQRNLRAINHREKVIFDLPEQIGHSTIISLSIKGCFSASFAAVPLFSADFFLMILVGTEDLKLDGFLEAMSGSSITSSSESKGFVNSFFRDAFGIKIGWGSETTPTSILANSLRFRMLSTSVPLQERPRQSFRRDSETSEPMWRFLALSTSSPDGLGRFSALNEPLGVWLDVTLGVGRNEKAGFLPRSFDCESSFIAKFWASWMKSSFSCLSRVFPRADSSCLLRPANKIIGKKSINRQTSKSSQRQQLMLSRNKNTEE